MNQSSCKEEYIPAYSTDLVLLLVEATGSTGSQIGAYSMSS